MSKIRKFMARCFAVGLIVCLTSQNISVYASEIGVQNDDLQEVAVDEAKEINEYALFEMKVAATSDNLLNIDNVKRIEDFEGNEYTVIECNPSGYYIYHNESGNFVEYSEDSPSPYFNLTGKLYYGGPTFYYIEKEGILQHTIEGNEKIDVLDEPGLKEMSAELNTKLVQNADENILNMVKGNTYSRANITPRASYTYVTDYNIIKSLSGNNVGYYSEGGGCCGYVAANIILYYWQRRQPSKTYIPSSWYNSTGLVGNSLTQNLVSIGKSLGYGSDSYPNTISDVLYRYCSDRNIAASMGYWYTNINAQSEISNNRPTILFGSFYSTMHQKNINHAVVIYGYDNSTGQFVSHFGYNNGYSHVTLSGLVGGNTYFRPN